MGCCTPLRPPPLRPTSRPLHLHGLPSPLSGSLALVGGLGWLSAPQAMPHAPLAPLSGCQGSALPLGVTSALRCHLCPSVALLAIGATPRHWWHSAYPLPWGGAWVSPRPSSGLGGACRSARANERSVRAQPRGPEPRELSNGGLHPGATKFQIFEVHIRSDRSIQTAVQEEHVLSLPGQDAPTASHLAGTTVALGSPSGPWLVVNRVFLCELMAMLAVRFLLVEQPVRVICVLHVLFMRADFEVLWSNTRPVVTQMPNNKPSRHWPYEILRTPDMNAPCFVTPFVPNGKSLVLDGKLTISVCIESCFPCPASTSCSLCL